MKNKNSGYEYLRLKKKLYLRLIGITAVSFLIIFALYILIWRGRGGDRVVAALQNILDMPYDKAYYIYQYGFRNFSEIIWLAAVLIVFIVLMRVILRWFSKYFDMTNHGIDALLSDDEKIELPPEMSETERKLSAVKSELKQRALAAELANRRKNELVMYLAHDIRTPLTSVIGYLSLMSEVPDMPAEQRAKYVNISLEKANRLDKMLDEFFEITRYNLQNIDIEKKQIDLYYMLMQICDELSPVLSANGNTAAVDADENITICGDPDKLARVFNNFLKNAAAYSFPDTEIIVSALQNDRETVISFKNNGRTIPKDKLPLLFEKFYRSDDSRASNTGGAGLGLAIAKEIAALHGGTIDVESENETTTFTVRIPTRIPENL